MSIVNDALKKASKEFEYKDQDTYTGAAASGKEFYPSSDRKWTAIITLSLVIIASLFGSLILYKNMTKIDTGYVSSGSGKSVSAIQSALNSMEQKNVLKAMRSQDFAKLNGIVYGDQGKWAIVNDKIVKEGDKLLGGEIISITRDLVKIEKNDGSEVTLSLK
ncbi:MAG: hypothetical protein CO035_00925 [Candidatus Omnitrophica bacterium CG_4_9_14_0_2_um_filter_42_8]|nr:MAG: hypothetical protein COW92_00955 [Candidatus Omnitrophica bacterium CG22_combo_CG10-13_8_21_14_all_43_16]PJC48918.1 MAG: hypothetical protein CO035_00925 [Candidatus Omnitrophica bacterium CG_4_9_14_0_2_um_filter_42_8]